MKDYFLSYGILFGKRFTRSQKNKFINAFAGELEGLGYSPSLYAPNDKKAANIIFGDVESAKVILIANYDTGSKILLPGYRYYPVDAKKNIQSEMRSLLISMVLGAVILGGAYILFRNTADMATGFAKIALIMTALALIAFAMYVMGGIANRINYSRNSASIVLIRHLADKLQGQRQKIAFILADRCISSFEGYRLVQDMFQEKGVDTNKKQIMLLDCLANGEDLCLAYGKGAEHLAEKILSVGEHLGLKGLYLDDEHLARSPLKFIDQAIILMSGELTGGDVAVKKVQSGKDYDVDVERLEAISYMLFQYVEDLS